MYKTSTTEYQHVLFTCRGKQQAPAHRNDELSCALRRLSHQAIQAVCWGSGPATHYVLNLYNRRPSAHATACSSTG